MFQTNNSFPLALRFLPFELLNIQVVYSTARKSHLTTRYTSAELRYKYSSNLSLTSALDGVGGQHHVRSASGKKPDTHCTVGLVGLGVALDRCGKSRLSRVVSPGSSVT
jgi:hypothetical protein